MGLLKNIAYGSNELSYLSIIFKEDSYFYEGSFVESFFLPIQFKIFVLVGGEEKTNYVVIKNMATKKYIHVYFLLKSFWLIDFGVGDTDTVEKFSSLLFFLS